MRVSAALGSIAASLSIRSMRSFYNYQKACHIVCLCQNVSRIASIFLPFLLLISKILCTFASENNIMQTKDTKSKTIRI